MKKLFILTFLVLLMITSSINCKQIKGKKPQSVRDIYYLNGNNVEVSVWVKNLNIPWSLVFIDKNTALVSERPGTIRLIKNGKVKKNLMQKLTLFMRVKPV